MPYTGSLLCRLKTTTGRASGPGKYSDSRHGLSANLLHSQECIHGRRFVPVRILQSFSGAISVETHFTDAVKCVFLAGRFAVGLGPVFGGPVKLFTITEVHFGHFGVLRVAWFRAAHQGLQAQQGRLDSEGGRPLIFENVEADGSRLRRDIRVPDFGIKFHFRGFDCERVERYHVRRQSRGVRFRDIQIILKRTRPTHVQG